jgi:hypothetical protein
MAKGVGLEELWNSARRVEHVFQTAELSSLPEGVRRYLEHAIAPETRLSHAVRLRMHGEIKLQRWLPFKADQVIVWGRGFVWRATVRMFGLPVRGFDRLVDAQGEMRWRLLGLIPVMTASGPDISRSAAGRLAGEALWLPSVLCGDDVLWRAPTPSRLQACFTAHGETSEIEISVDDRGRPRTVKLARWGNPGNSEFQYADFGAVVEDESSFGGYTIPSRLRAGWYFGTARFESEGEFFRATVTDAKHL